MANITTARDAVLAEILGISNRRWGGLAVAVVSVAVMLAIGSLLRLLGDIRYPPLTPAIVVTALLAGRLATAAAVGLSILADLFVSERAGPLDAALNALVFAAVSWALAEVVWGLRKALREKSAEARALARDALVDTLADTIPGAVLDRAGRIRRLTPMGGAFLGLSETAAAGRSITDFVLDFGPEHLARLERGEPLEQPAAGFWTARRADGRDLQVSVMAGLIPRAAGEDYAVVCLGDLSQMIVARRRARDLHAQLNQIWRLNSLGEMAAILAHELNQPLSAAAVYLHSSQADMKAAGPYGESAERTLELAKGQLLRAGGIIRRMRDLLATGTLHLEAEHVGSMVEDLQSVFVLVSRDSDVAIRLDIDPDDAVMADRIQFQQAVTNLVRNGVEAAGGRADAVVVIVGRGTPDAYEISVEDNGPGIPDDEIDRILQPLTTTKTGGMGLGLSVTQSIVESHGGKLEVGRSPTLGGAAFRFRLSRKAEYEHA